MILHIGNGKTVRHRDIIGIFDLDNITVRSFGREFIARATKEKRVVYADNDIPRSFLLVEEEKSPHNERGRRKKDRPPTKAYVLLSHISSLSLANRAADAAYLNEEE